ncbi:MAG: glucose PTS transporter subunit IIA [Bilifractor sp.]|jgi:PTS system sucrose-specific IIC component
MDYAKTAKGVLDNVGGPDNVISAAHCATRLRLVIADNSKLDKNAVEMVDGVKGCFEASGQIQVIIGTGAVNKVYDEFIKMAGVSEASKSDVKEAAAQKQNWFFRAIKTLGDIFVPIIPAIVASGLLNGILNGILQAVPSLGDSNFYSLINLFAGAALSMLPILIAMSAAKKFGGNEFLAAVIGFIMIHPNLVNAWNQYIDDGSGNLIKNPDIVTWFDFGSFKVENVGYQGHVIPVIIAILFMSWLEKKLHKIVPEIIDLFVTPLVTVLATGILTMMFIGPIFGNIENWILKGARALIGLPFGIGGLLVGFLYAFTVVAGFHHMYNMIEAQMVSNGLNTWMPVATAANVGQGAAALAVSMKSKSKKTKEVAGPSSLSAFLGITEPAIFGVNLRNRTSFIAACCGGAVGGMLASLFGVGATAYGITGLFGFLIVPDYIPQYAIVMAASFAVAFIVSFITYKDDPEQLAREKAAEAAAEKEEEAEEAVEVVESTAPVEETKTDAGASAVKAEAAGEAKMVFSPAKGTAIPLSAVHDATFASEALGKGMAVIPTEGKIYAPFDGTLDMLYDTKHALGLTSKDDVEVLIHVGIDTVKLNGKYFTAHVESGAEVKKGDLLLEFDIDKIKEAGYFIDTVLIVTNSDDYDSVEMVTPTEPGMPVLAVR